MKKRNIISDAIKGEHIGTVYTIGHSTRSAAELLQLLNIHHIKTLVDVRHFPGSRKFPHFNKENLEVILPEAGIHYHHVLALGGRRKGIENSHNTGWRHPAFRSYADYMETGGFAEGINELVKYAAANTTAYMCSEAVWWRCHRALISDYLKLTGWRVVHILSATKTEEHPFTQPAKIVEGRLSYEGEDQHSE